MAFDDVNLEYGACGSFGACSFDDGSYCSWSNVADNRDDFDWEFGTGKTQSVSTGPE